MSDDREQQAAQRALDLGLVLVAQVGTEERRFTLLTESDLDLGQVEELLAQWEKQK